MEAKTFLLIAFYAAITLFRTCLANGQDLVAPSDGEEIYFEVMGFITQYNELGHHVNQFLDGIGDECRHIWTTYNNRWTATRLGDPLQIEREIQLYGKSFFQDVPYKVKGSIPSIIPPLKVRSFYFSGNYSWGLFTGPKFTGDTICFLPRIEGREWGITAFSMFVFPVKSVEEGC
ncbi:hypothetical protein Fcan01_16527 [Folsomia candida]|uniref:Uncharacterized protein n=1 Tax=Folsomia candida TaxID=158441 RepID=A0A226DVE9_FOLCA|nr:hypothetical protein Fcan01_16527 [Folsomia candida]